MLFKFVSVFLALLVTAFGALPSDDYLPPLQDIVQVNTADLQALAEASPLTDDGYRYRTVKHYRHRLRRDVNELSALNYLPPISDAALVADIPVAFDVAAENRDSSALADDGYHYRTLKRFRLRQRRDVNEVGPVNEYLPPVEERAAAVRNLLQGTQTHKAEGEVRVENPSQAQNSAVLGDDGYRYKTFRRVVYRHRV